MRRREFLAAVGGAAALMPFVSASTTAGKVPSHRIAWFWYTFRDPRPMGRSVRGGHLRELGWIDGRNVASEYRWAEGSYRPAFAEIAAEFVGDVKKVAVVRHMGNDEPGPRGEEGDIGHSRQSLRSWAIRLATTSLRAWRNRAATSLACRVQGADLCRQATLNSYVRVRGLVSAPFQGDLAQCRQGFLRIGEWGEVVAARPLTRH